MKRKRKRSKKVRSVLMVTIIFLLPGILLSGCITNNNNSNNSNIKVPLSNPKDSITDSDTSWCQEGTNYSAYTSDGRNIMKVIGITTYKGKTVCESNHLSPDGSSITMYVSQDGKFSWQVSKDKDGKIKYEGGMNNP